MPTGSTRTYGQPMATVEYESRDRVALITLNRPEARNAVNGELAAALEAAIDRLEDDDSLWLGVICANGPVFCAGADLKAISSGAAAEIETPTGGFGGFVKKDRTKPIIAAVDGPAVAGGLELVLAADLVVASMGARFGIPEVKRSLVAAAGGLTRLPRKIPANIAMEMAITGDPIEAQRAYELGLVNVLCEPGEVVDRAFELAARVNENAPLAVRASRAEVAMTFDTTDAEGFHNAGRAMLALSSTDDFSEGPLAFIEKRDPDWKGR